MNMNTSNHLDNKRIPADIDEGRMNGLVDILGQWRTVLLVCGNVFLPELRQKVQQPCCPFHRVLMAHRAELETDFKQQEQQGREREQEQQQ